MKTEKPKINFMAVALFLVATTASHSANAVSTGPRDITYLGGHSGDMHSYVGLSGAAFGPAACPSTEVRWDASTDSGKRQYNSLMAAYMARRKVSFELSNSCWGTFVTAVYFHVH